MNTNFYLDVVKGAPPEFDCGFLSHSQCPDWATVFSDPLKSKASFTFIESGMWDTQSYDINGQPEQFGDPNFD